ncbi:MAG TPA: sugar phosphate isomerase/epimerase family protein [Terriglobia bacterium]|nr:sugar phosphate isomerase/epimerase family protein [Terriglobia bacterium]
MTLSGPFSRRAFLTHSGAALAGAALSGSTARAQSSKQRVRFGVRSPLPDVGLRERALLVKRLGYDGIELGNEWSDHTLDALREQLDGIDIAVSAMVGSIKLLDTDRQVRAEAVETDRKRLEVAQALGASALIEVPTFGPTKFQDLSPIMTPREIEDRLLVAGLKQLIPDVQRTGVKLLIEPCNRKETHYIYQQSQAAEIIEQVGAPGFTLLSDFFHMQLEEKDIAETLARYGKYTAYVHLADGAARTEPGSLPFDYRPGFHALKKWGFSGWLTVESKATDNPEAALARALPYLKKQWSEA